MEVYEVKQEKLKQERRLVEEQIQKEELELEVRLKNLNTQLEKINSAKNKAELKEIEIYLDGIVISDFGIKSNEAGFILNQLKLTCSMASRLMKDEEEKPVEAPKMETTPITDNFLEELKEMRSEPSKMVVIEEPIVVEEKELETISEPIAVEKKELEVFVQEEINSEPQTNFVERKATDDDVIALIDVISEDVITEVMNLVDERTKSIINNKEIFEKLDLNLYKDFLYREVKIRVGVLLKNNQVK
jgi:hypothetical protein